MVVLPFSLPTVAWMPLSLPPILIVRNESSWKSPGSRTRMRMVFSVSSGAGLDSSGSPSALAERVTVAGLAPQRTGPYS